jgi:hypothetical protein
MGLKAKHSVSTTNTGFDQEVSEARVDSAIAIEDDEPAGLISPIPLEYVPLLTCDSVFRNGRHYSVRDDKILTF